MQWRIQGGSFVAGDSFASLDAGWSVAGASLWNPGTGWQVAAVGDYGGDGRSDILWRQAATPGGGATEVKVWTMNGMPVVRDELLAVVPEAWQIV